MSFVVAQNFSVSFSEILGQNLWRTAYCYDQHNHTELKHNSTTLIAADRKTARSDYKTMSHVIQEYMLIYAVSQH